MEDEKMGNLSPHPIPLFPPLEGKQNIAGITSPNFFFGDILIQCIIPPEKASNDGRWWDDIEIHHDFPHTSISYKPKKIGEIKDYGYM